MAGMSARTGIKINGTEHLRQSLADILTTPIGSRVMRRDYGSLLPDIIDQPLNQATLLQAYAATAMAIAQWEPRVTLEKVEKTISSEHPGRVVFQLDIIHLDTGTPERARLDVPIGNTSGITQ